MKIAFSKSICLLTGLLFALTLTFSCSNDDNTNGEDGSSSSVMSGGGSSSSVTSGGWSSSSVTSGGDLSSSSSSSSNDGSFTGNSEYEDMKEFYKYYNPDNASQKCVNGVVELKCGDVWYNPLTYSCEESWIGDDHSYVLGTIGFCGNKLYSSIYGRCRGGILEERCPFDSADDSDDIWYNTETHYCSERLDPESGTYIYIGTIIAKEPCGNELYSPNTQRCQGGIVQEKCRGSGEDGPWYNPKTEGCYYNNDGIFTVKALELCGNQSYIPNEFRRCQDGVVERKCGDVWYNRITHICNENSYTVKAKVRCAY